ncbi:MAG: hypothetical protein JWN15_746 [Firmicutes bacterium]|nr:hypothetical protein [Bacillota bacterium]
MQCESCGQRPATIHQTVIMNGHKQESHLCESCSHEQGKLGGMSAPNFAFPNLSIHDLLSSFLGQQPLGATVAPRAQAEPHCRNCGMTYSQFAETGRLGCAQCYDDLEPQLLPLIKRIHGTATHTGKAPKRTGGLVRKKRELEGLRRELHDAIAQEQYEEAARLRDVIRKTETEIQAGGDSDVVE